MAWLASGLRRDICILLYGNARHAQQVKTMIETRYDRRLSPEQFYGALTALAESGIVAIQEDDLQDVCTLTEKGRQSVIDQYEWMKQHITEPEN